MSEIRKRIVFYGRVQGVGFRYTAKYLAQSLQLTGWVKNEWDGTVTMEIQGREPIEWMDTKEIPLEKESSFTVR